MKSSTARLLAKAARAISAAERLLREGDSEFAVGRAYYAMFYTAEALLDHRGLSFRKHSGVHVSFGLHFIKAGLLDARFHHGLLAAFNKRIIGDYGIDETITCEEVQEMLELAKEFLTEATRLITIEIPEIT